MTDHWRDQPRVPAGEEGGGQWTDGNYAKKSAIESRMEAAAREGAGLPAQETILTYMDENGNWTPERQALHEEIIAEVFEGKTPVENPESYIMGGGGASGKSTLVRQGMVDIDPNSVHADADAVKYKLPEMQKSLAAGELWGARAVHEESSYLAKEIARRAFLGNFNLVLDGIGNNSADHLYGKLLNIGLGTRPVHGVYVTADIETAIARAVKRGRETGRFSSRAIVANGHVKVSRLFPTIASQGWFTTLRLYDNNVDWTPRLIGESKGGGQFEILDYELWNRFISKVEYDISQLE